ncbi:MAG: AAA family ATPase [Gammaproteobacteria bacterium]|nr:AAA family ATPase [Gammaproteobacteria bacterium]NNF61349.1 AAA family ATPase [Gammaproteobacteria bacterium]
MHSDAAHQNLPPLIRGLCSPEAWPHPVSEVRAIETHVSWVLLTGEYAYKIKRPVTLGFLDFSTLGQRRQACEEELRLNQRLSPQLYESVVAITGSESAPKVAADSSAPEAIEYAVRMREFKQDSQLDRQLLAGSLELGDMDKLAAAVAAMHDQAKVADDTSDRGTVEAIAQPAMANFTTLDTLVDDAGDRSTLLRLGEWTATQVALLRPRFEQRRHDGRIRENHGDLHLSNLAAYDNQIVAFDCIEFDPALRWRDCMSEVGFLVMDLAARQRVDMAWRFLNRYLELTGDYNGTALLRFYIVYASMVRAKIAAIRAEQNEPGSQVYMDAARHYRMHLALAERAIRPRFPALIITNGLTGSGKTWLTSRLASVIPAIRLRSDIERKRLHGIDALDTSNSAPGAGIYTAEATQQTYRYLRDRAADVLAASFDVIVDAALLTSEQRGLFVDLARQSTASLVILECVADPTTLRERITQRAWDGGDASEADVEVLGYQQRNAQPLTDEERVFAINIDTAAAADPLRVVGEIWRKLGRETGD